MTASNNGFVNIKGPYSTTPVIGDQGAIGERDCSSLNLKATTSFTARRYSVDLLLGRWQRGCLMAETTVGFDQDQLIGQQFGWLDVERRPNTENAVCC